MLVIQELLNPQWPSTKTNKKKKTLNDQNQTLFGIQALPNTRDLLFNRWWGETTHMWSCLKYIFLKFTPFERKNQSKSSGTESQSTWINQITLGEEFYIHVSFDSGAGLGLQVRLGSGWADSWPDPPKLQPYFYFILFFFQHAPKAPPAHQVQSGYDILCYYIVCMPKLDQ